MSILLQNILVLILVAACGGYAVWGAVQTLFGKRSSIGKCCSKGCPTAPEPNKPAPANRVVFLPVELLRKSK